MRGIYVAIAALLMVSSAVADVYMQSPRGSNNRLDEANRDRNNGNRMFDSQNNNRGGSNVGSTYYYSDTVMNIDWTNQHSCGAPNCECTMIIQYMCDPLLRDGTTTNRITESQRADVDVQFGRHESFQYYQTCKYTSRNKGLFYANQNLQGNGAIYTRQNPNGNRNGFECPEERDYYPYWRPTPWVDVAILTNSMQRCDAYVANSENAVGRWYCQAPASFIKKNQNQNGFIPINQTECEALRGINEYDPVTNETVRGQWVQAPANGMKAPICTGAHFTRDNHLGNVAGGYFAGFNWTLSPASILPNEHCVLRIRYNISTLDTTIGDEVTGAGPGLAMDQDWESVTSVQSGLVDSRQSFRARNNNQARDPALLPIWQKYRLTESDVSQSLNLNQNDPNGATIKSSRDYVLKNNPKVDIFGNTLVPRGGDTAAPKMVRLQLAINTNQFGRTFEDRSFRFAVRARPTALEGVVIHNIQVGGKRGNIVQTYPGTEYFFQPARLFVRNGDYVHFQWTGSNTNPNNNAGQGQQGTDRHNVLLLRDQLYWENQPMPSLTQLPTYGQLGAVYPNYINASATNTTFLGWDATFLQQLAIATNDASNGAQSGFYGDMDELNSAGVYFDAGPKQVTQNGIYHYVCTRNNNFSNRDQKGTLIVSDASAQYATIGWNGGSILSSTSRLRAAPGAMSQVVTFTVVTHPPETYSSLDGGADSDYVQVIPTELPLLPGQYVHLEIDYPSKPLIIPTVFHSTDFEGSWGEVGASFDGGVAYVDMLQGGIYTVQTVVNWGAVVGIVLAVMAVLGGGLFYLYKRNGGKLGAKLGASKGAGQV